MKITICGSMAFAKEMQETKSQLETMGHLCYAPEGIGGYIYGQYISGVEGAKRKIENDLIREHYRKIQNSDAILVLNYPKKGVNGYIGGNSFLEMGFAHILDKPIYLLHNVPDIQFIKEELLAMQPTVLHGDLTKIA